MRDRLFVDVGDRDLYNQLDQKEPMLKGKRREQFLLAAAIGFRNGVHRPLEKREGGGFFLSKDLKTEDRALIDALALSHQGTSDVLADEDRVFSIAEEYAHAGVHLLAQMEASTPLAGSFDKRFEQEIMELYEEFTTGGQK